MQMAVYDKLKYRMPKQMMTQLFPPVSAAGASYIAETLDSEGWFDSEGWDIPVWFEKMPGRQGDVDRVGTDRKYHSQLAWKSVRGVQGIWPRKRHVHRPGRDRQARKAGPAVPPGNALKEDEVPQASPRNGASVKKVRVWTPT